MFDQLNIMIYYSVEINLMTKTDKFRIQLCNHNFIKDD